MDIHAILAQMTLEEKAGLCSGLDNWHTKAVERLNLPSIMVADGPHGLRKEKPSKGEQAFVPSYPATCFPTASALACSWNRELLFKVGEALAEECLQEGVSVILGPGVNIKRSPLCGRNFEYYSEDPYLSGEMAIQHIRGVQSKGIGTSLKHFAANNQEYRRMAINAVVDERALREIYLVAFERAVKEAQPWTVMCAYNRLNGEYCSENESLLTGILREEWGFDGLVVSDWGAVNQRVRGLKAGLDLEMPGGKMENDQKIVQAVQHGDLDEADLDRCVERILTLIQKGIEGRREGYRYDAQAHHVLARQAAAESIVLLKNENNILPLDPNQKIAVVGDFAKVPRYQGYGSSVINPTQLDCAFDEIVKYSADAENILYAQGFLREEDAIRFDLVEEACRMAAQAQVVLVFLGLPESHEIEGMDREDMLLPENQNDIVVKLLNVNPNVVVVLSNGSPVCMPWAEQVPGIVEAYLSGQAGGGAMADVLFGKVNPSGKLAETFPLALADNPSFHYFPGGAQNVEYRESIYVGYRYYDKAKQAVRFPFGHGLSYTQFTYEKMQVVKNRFKAGEKVEVHCSIRNSGKRAGQEVVQLYVGRVDETGFWATQELKGFEKVSLEPGEIREIIFHLNERSFAFYDVDQQDWRIAAGEYRINIGASSHDLHLSEVINIDNSDPLHFSPDLDAYTTLKGNHFDQEAFYTMIGKPLPDAGKEKRRKIDINTPLIDFRKSLPGKLVFAILRNEIRKNTGQSENAYINERMEQSMLETPLQNLTNFSNGSLTEKTATALVQLANGKLAAAIKALLTK